MPGLTRRERVLARKSFGFAFVLFVLGAAMGYFFCLPIALRMMLRIHAWLGISPEWTVNDYVAFATQMLIGFGLAFELPVVVLVLGKLGIVSVEQLSAKRRHVVVICLAIGMLLTPQDIASQLIMAVPLYVLFELCLLILRVDRRKQERQAG
jgi:sec-independent protein translocase protein TatC